MMKLSIPRRGSALLVVLGMLAFMLFSGLAFSVYMRQSRLPTSFLRRTSTTRQLTKAALAEAIDQIDRAIGNDPHPDLRANGKIYREDVLDNAWSHRVFFGLCWGNEQYAVVDGKQQKIDAKIAEKIGYLYPPEKTEYDQDGIKDEDVWLVDPSGISPTVPTLTLEGLAYLPPNLINEARYYSQRTPTAKWHSFWFDSGRYAYTAIDVSDYFDVNRMFASRPRSACASRRLSLAHLFEQGADHSSAGSGAKEWDDPFMVQYRKVGNDDEITYPGDKCPFVSMADFNIAWGPKKGGLKNPFYDFVMNGRPYDCSESADDAEAEKYRNMTFVTDGLFPKPTRPDSIKVADLEEERYQPFKRTDLESQCNLDFVAEYADSELFKGQDYFGGGRICQLTRMALWDYLDEDKVPLSLAVPTCEQVPMICGIQPMFEGMKFKVRTDPANPSDADTPLQKGEEFWPYQRKVKYFMVLDNVAGSNGGGLNGRFAWTYPFLTKGQRPKTKGTPDTFSVDGRVAIFLTDAEGTDMTARPGNEIKGLYLESNGDVAQGGVINETVITYPISTQISNFDPEDVFTKCDKKSVKGGFLNSKSGGSDDYGLPVQDFQFSCEAEKNAAAASADGRLMVTVTYTWNRKKLNKETGDWVDLYVNPENDPNVQTTVEAAGSDGFGLLKKDGKRDSDFSFLVAKDEDKKKRKVRVNVAVWARVTDSNKKTVDLVPACLMDDDNLNAVRNTGMAPMLGDADPYPLLTFDAGEMEFSLAKFNSGDLGTFSVSGKALFTGDPRYNHAPENWQLVDGAGSDGLARTWYDREYADAKIKDGDVFMATSDQTHMQSVYELMMLPRMQGLTAGSSKGMLGEYSANYDGKVRNAAGVLKDRVFMWRTYNRDDFSELGDGRIVCGDNGVKVNPYSDSKKVLMAAFANTPHDWRVASVDNEDVPDTVAEFNKQCAWNDYEENTVARGKICWEHLENVAGAFIEDMHDEQVLRAAKSRKDADEGKKIYRDLWAYVYDDLGWSTNRRKILEDLKDLEEGEDSDLYSVDKKFLYGFWHDCFAARQQLFLIFVRAEPMMMGGGVQGQIPPQLGARAVALVWRDPTATKGTRSVDDQTLPNPHHTRILFYHQFD